LPMPKALYHELATWATINFAYTYKNERELGEMVLQACERDKVERLLKVVRQRLGHRLALAVEEAKIALSDAPGADICLAFLEKDLLARPTLVDFEQAIDGQTDRLFRTARACVTAAGLSGDSVDTIFLTGGSSRVPAVRAAIARAAPSARLATGSDLLSVG